MRRGCGHKKLKYAKKGEQTDRPTRRGVESRSTRLKRVAPNREGGVDKQGKYGILTEKDGSKIHRRFVLKILILSREVESKRRVEIFEERYECRGKINARTEAQRDPIT